MKIPKIIKLSKKAGEFLVKVSRLALEKYFETGKPLTLKQLNLPQDIKSELLRKQASFVTLKKQGNLRGCIGHLEAIMPLIEDVITNTYAAAFNDPRFYPLLPNELSEVQIEVSVLSPKVHVNFSSADELLEFLNKHKPGVVLSLYGKQATFLPQVWEDLPNAQDFLAHLCLKAGHDINCWQNPQTKLEIYTVQDFHE